MINERLLARVDDDLAQGHTHVAIQRLTSYVQSHPTDLDARGRLAAVHLATGNLVEAGRWSYLAEDADDEAVVAFERATRDPRTRLDNLRWTSTTAGLGPSAKARMDALERAAARQRRRRNGSGEPLTTKEKLKDAAGATLFFGIVLFVLLCLGVGFVTVLRTLF